MALEENSPAYRKAYKHYLKSSHPPADTSHWSAFRIEEKLYKTRFPRPSLENVLDLSLYESDSNASEQRDSALRSAGWSTGYCDKDSMRSIRTEGGTRAFTLSAVPGLVVLPGFLTSEEQRNLIISSLRDLSRHPNETNLDAHYDVPHEGLWNIHETHQRGDSSSSSSRDSDPIIRPKLSPAPSASSSMPSPTKRTEVNNTPTSPSSLPAILSTPQPPPTPSNSLKPLPASKLLYKMRWANLGRSYHWGTKAYDFKKKLAPISEDVRSVCKRAVGCVDWDDVWGREEVAEGEGEWGDERGGWRSWKEDYEPDAGIINFYQTTDTLMGHVDRSELSSTTPLVSISLVLVPRSLLFSLFSPQASLAYASPVTSRLGNAAIFLIGGLTRDTKPLPILLRSGDVLIMSGPRCRRAYHGVPRILERSLPPHLDIMSRPSDSEATASYTDEEWEPFGKYMASTRININVRQVFPRGFEIPQEMLAGPEIDGDGTESGRRSDHEP